MHTAKKISFRLPEKLWEKIQVDCGDDKLPSEVVREIIREHYESRRTRGRAKREIKYAKAIPVQ